MQNIGELKRILSSPKKVVIIPHQKPDADALGSCLALKGYLNKLQHEVQIISPTDYPQFLAWMPENESVLICNILLRLFGFGENSSLRYMGISGFCYQGYDRPSYR
jgi:hypothetical protein